MTFEQWWAAKESALRRGIFAGVDDQLLASAIEKQLGLMRAEFAECWNEAVEACAEICGDAEGVDFGMTERLKVKL